MTDWMAIQSTCFVVLAGSNALMGYVLWRITRNLMATHAEMVRNLGHSREGGMSSEKDMDLAQHRYMRAWGAAISKQAVKSP